MNQNIHELIEDHMYLVPFVINKYFSAPNQDVREELTSIGYEALVRASQKYNPEIAKFSTFAKLKIRSRIMDHFKKIYRRKRIADFFSIDLEGDEGTTFHERIEDDSARYEKTVASKTDIERWLSSLSPDEKQIISLFVGLEEEEGSRTLDEISEVVGFSKATVFRKKKVIIEKLRESADLVS